PDKSKGELNSQIFRPLAPDEGSAAQFVYELSPPRDRIRTMNVEEGYFFTISIGKSSESELKPRTVAGTAEHQQRQNDAKEGKTKAKIAHIPRHPGDRKADGQHRHE